MLMVRASEPAPMPAMVTVTVWAFRCYRCEHAWLPREYRPPRVCPKCKSPYWDRPRRHADV